ncbi:MAG: serine hydrolase [Pseudomonadota bacterium]
MAENPEKRLKSGDMNRVHTPTRRGAVAAGLAAAALSGFGRTAAAASGYDAALSRAAALDQLHALVIADRQTVLAAKAFRGPALDRPANVKSVSKSIVALLTGIAIDQGILPGPAARLGDIAPRLIPTGADPRAADITIADLLTLRAGLQRTSGANYGGWVASRDWVADALARPFVADPGARFLYSTGTTHVLGAVLAERSGQSLLQLARDWLGAPLDITVPAWTRDPQGRYMGGNNMALAPLALARLGQSLLNGGAWQGRQVVPSGWLAQSWTARTRSPFSRHDYGYGWFLTDLAGTRVAYARGYGGQMLYVAPDRGLTVAVTSDPTRPARSAGYAGTLNRLVTETVLSG